MESQIEVSFFRGGTQATGVMIINHGTIFVECTYHFISEIVSNTAIFYLKIKGFNGKFRAITS